MRRQTVRHNICHIRILRLLSGLIFAVSLALGAAVLTQTVRAEQAITPSTPEPEQLMALVRNTMLAIDAGNKSGDYSALHAMASTAFKATLTPAQLAERMADLRARNIDLSPAMTLTPLTTGPPMLDRNGRLRIVGYFDFPERHIIYEFVYDFDVTAADWRVGAVTVTPRDKPEEPDLLQPQ